MKAIILAGGKGTRLPHSAKNIPKALVRIGGKPVLQHQLDLLEKHGFNNVRLALGFKAGQIIKYLNGKYEYVVEAEPLGTGGAVKFASKDLSEPFMVMNGDVISNLDITAFVKCHRQNTSTIAIAYQKRNTDFGLIKTNKDGRITQFLEKPSKPTDGYVNIGFYILDPRTLTTFNHGSFSIEYDVFPRLAQKQQLYGFKHKGYWIDIGTEKRLILTKTYEENAKLTLFTVPSALKGERGVIQKNAIMSWTRLHKDVEILLFGNAEEIHELTTLYPHTIRHIPDIKTNPNGTPFVNDVFKKAAHFARHNLLCYVKSNIILTSHLIEMIKKLPVKQKFFMVARQTDINIHEPIIFHQNWEENLLDQIKKEGKLHGSSAMNIMLFPKHIPLTFNDLLIGRPGWDNAVAYQIINRGIPIIDGTLAITAIHQNYTDTYTYEEAAYNFKLAGGLSQLLTINNASVIFAPHGIEKAPLLKRLYSYLLFLYPVRKLLALKRWIYYSYIKLTQNKKITINYT